MSGRRQLQRLWRIYLRRRSVLLCAAAALVVFALLLANLAATVNDFTRGDGAAHSTAYNASKRHVKSILGSAGMYNSTANLAAPDTESAMYMVAGSEGVAVYPACSSDGPAASGLALPYGSVLTGEPLPSRGEGGEGAAWLRVLFPFPGCLRLFANSAMQVVPLRADSPAAATSAAGAAQAAGSRDLNKLSSALLPALTEACQQKVFRRDVDFNGGDLPSGEETLPHGPGPNPTSAQSASACCLLCVQHSAACARWTFVATDGLCYVKDATARLVTGRTGLVSGSVGSSAAREQYLALKARMQAEAEAPAATVRACCEVDNHLSPGAEASVVIKGASAAAAEPISPESFWAAATDGASPYSLRVGLTHAGWTQQWPVGSGLVGAFVGGSIRGEVVPLSIADLFVRRVPRAPMASKAKDAKDAPSGDGKKKEKKKEEGSGTTDSPLEAFQDTRRLLAAGAVGAAHARAKSMFAGAAGPQLGGFQYVADLSFVYASSALSPRATSPQPPQAKKSKASPPKKAAPAGASATPAGRAALLAALQGLFESARAEASPAILSEGLLDMKNGVAHSFFVERDALNATRVHHREWFSTSVDGHVLCGRIACQRGKGSGGCVNLAMQTSREGTHPLPRTDIAFAEVSATRSHKLDKSTSLTRRAEDATAKMFTFSLAMESSTPLEHVPRVAMCGLALCRSEQASIVPTPWGGAGARALICNGAEAFELLLSIDIADTAAASGGSSCWQRVARAYAQGRESLRRRHTSHFSAAMLRTELRFSSSRTAQACPAAPLADRLKSAGSGCSTALSTSTSTSASTTSAADRAGGVDTHLFSQAFQYSRYLLLSSGSGSTMNLQGLWAEGPVAAWNGDYHLNINMQMTYWAAHAAGLRETTAPLHAFIQALAAAGRSTARDMYGCSAPGAWVAHGFTDNALSAGLLGDAQWSLCVTCGAWLATHLVDSLSFSLDR